VLVLVASLDTSSEVRRLVTCDTWEIAIKQTTTIESWGRHGSFLSRIHHVKVRLNSQAYASINEAFESTFTTVKERI